MEEHSEPLLDSARDASSDTEESTTRVKTYAPNRFYEKKAFLWVSALWFTGSVLLFASALLLHTRSRGRHAEIYCKTTVHTNACSRNVCILTNRSTCPRLHPLQNSRLRRIARKADDIHGRSVAARRQGMGRLIRYVHCIASHRISISPP
jgi:hypothetical protein